MLSILTGRAQTLRGYDKSSLWLPLPGLFVPEEPVEEKAGRLADGLLLKGV